MGQEVDTLLADLPAQGQVFLPFQQEKDLILFESFDLIPV